MKKILDWTLGGIFRTIGRFIGFVIIGALVAYFIYKSDLRIPDFLGFMTVNASTTENWATKEVKIYTCHDDTCNWSNNYTANHTFSGNDLTYPVHAIEWRVKATNGLSIENSYTFSFGYKPTPDSLHPKTYFMRRNAQSSKESITCQTSTDSNGYYMNKCTFTPNEDYTSSEWLYIQIQFYDSYITNLNTKITAFEERQGINSIITQQTNEIIQQNEQNTQNIINNNNENTQTIINNQNSNTQQQIDAQKVCNKIDKDNTIKAGYLNTSNGYEIPSTGMRITDYIKISSTTDIIQLEKYDLYNEPGLCFYNINKVLISCISLASINNNIKLTIPNNADYIRISINKDSNKPQFKICNNGNQALLEQQEQNTQQQIDSQRVCYTLDKNYVAIKGKRLDSTGSETNSSSTGITNYIPIYGGTSFHLSTTLSIRGNYYCWYDSGKSLIDCGAVSTSMQTGDEFIFPGAANFVRFTLNTTTNYGFIKVCNNGNQANYESNHSLVNGIHDLQDTINSSDSSESSNAFLDFLDNFSETDFGLASIISMPLTLISNVTTQTCSPITIGGGTGMFEGVSFTLPCAMPFYEEYFGDFLTIYQMITFGVISCRILLDIFHMIHNFRNPTDDRIEVLDL